MGSNVEKSCRHLIKVFNFFSFSAILQVEYLREYSTKIKDIFASCALYKGLVNHIHCILAAFILSEIFGLKNRKKLSTRLACCLLNELLFGV